MRDAIVISGWTWEAFNIPERNAIALASLGARVLYCPQTISYFRKKRIEQGELERGIFSFTPRFLSSKANRIPGLPRVQAKMIAAQILNEAARLKLRNPIFVYSHLPEDQLPIAEEMKRHGLYLVHVAMDYPEPLLFEHVQLSDRTLVIERIIYHLLRARFGERIEMIPSAGRIASNGLHGSGDPPELASVPHPRPAAGFLGVAASAPECDDSPRAIGGPSRVALRLIWRPEIISIAECSYGALAIAGISWPICGGAGRGVHALRLLQSAQLPLFAAQTLGLFRGGPARCFDADPQFLEFGRPGVFG